MILTGFHVKNFGVLRDVRMGQVDSKKELPFCAVNAFVGQNGTGKTSVFELLSLLSDILRHGAAEALAAESRQGFDSLVSYDSETGKPAGPIELSLSFSGAETGGADGLLNYRLVLGCRGEKPYIAEETLRFISLNGAEKPPLLKISEGRGKMLTAQGEVPLDMADADMPAVAVLGSIRQNDVIFGFKNFVLDWFVGNFSPGAARSLPVSGAQRRLTASGDNLANVLQYMEQNDSAALGRLFSEISAKIPGLKRIFTKVTEDRRVLLCFEEESGKVHYVQRMSDGTLKLFAYLLMLNEGGNMPLICLEEPENGLYHSLLEVFVRELKDGAEKPRGNQIFMTTHSVHILNAMRPEEVWVFEKRADGFSTVKRVSADTRLVNLFNTDLQLGDLWYSEYFK